MINPQTQYILSQISDKTNLLYSLYTQSQRILYVNLKPDQYYNDWLETIEIDYSLFPHIFKYFRSINLNEINLILENYKSECQNVIDFIIGNSLEVKLESAIATIKESMVNLDQMAKTYWSSDESLSYQYEVPFDMSSRMVLFLNKKDFNNIVEFKRLVSLNPGKITDSNFIIRGTTLTMLKEGVTF